MKCIVRKNTLYSIFFYCCIFLCLDLTWIEYLMNLEDVIFIIKCLFGIVGSFLLLSKIKSISLPMKLISLLYAYIVVVTYINDQNMGNAIKTLISSFVVCIYIEYGINKYGDRFIKNTTFFLQLLVVIDLFTIIAFPNGMYSTALYSENWFLGYKTARITVSLPAITFSVINVLQDNKKLKLKHYIFMILCLIDAILASATGGMVTLTVYILLIISVNLQRNKNVKKILLKVFNKTNLTLGIIVVYTVFVFLQNFSFLNQFIVNILKKDITLNNRTVIWQTCIKLFYQHPILGNGIIPSNIFVKLTEIPGGTQPHNFLLGILVPAGIIGLIIYILIYINTFKKVKRDVFDNKYICSLSIIMTLVLGITSHNTFSIFNLSMYIVLYQLSNNRYVVRNHKRKISIMGK